MIANVQYIYVTLKSWAAINVSGHCHVGATSLPTFPDSSAKFPPIHVYTSLVPLLVDCSTLRNKFVVHCTMQDEKDFPNQLAFWVILALGNSHMEDCYLLWGSYKKHLVLSLVSIVPHRYNASPYPQWWCGNNQLKYWFFL